MASGDYDTKITLGMEADLTGGVQTEKQLEKVRAQAKKLEQDSKSGGASIEQAFGKATRAVGFFRKALAGFGVLSAITGLIAAVEKIASVFSMSKSKADAFAASAGRALAGEKVAIEELAKSYEALADATEKAADATKHANEVQDIAKKHARELEDAQMDLAEQKELAAVDASDPAAAEKRAEISARYAARRGLLNTSRQREDIDAQRSRLSADAGSKRAYAEKITSSLSKDDELIAKTERMIEVAERKAASRNELDRPLDSWIGNLKGYYTIDPTVDPFATEEGDAERRRNDEMAKSLREELEKLKQDREKKVKQADALRTEANRLEEKADAIYQAMETVDVKEKTARVTGQRGMYDAATSLDNKNKEIAKKKAMEEADRATIAQGPGRLAALQKKIDTVEAQKLAAQQADAKEQMDAILAQQALDSFNSAGHRRNGTGVQKQRSALEADVERETREATQSRTQLQSTLATLAATLKGLNADLNKVKREVDAATKRQAATNDEAPAG